MRYGNDSNSMRSMNAPGSPSSPLQMTYFTSPGDWRANFHFMPVGNPAPPRPRSPEARTSSTIASGVIVVSALRAAS